MKVTVEIKEVYGKELIYPVCEKAQTFAMLAKKKTLDRNDIQKIKFLGFEVELKQKELKGL